MINYAHRGASEYAPENTLSSFMYSTKIPTSFSGELLSNNGDPEIAQSQDMSR